jgi:hypothetical protein
MVSPRLIGTRTHTFPSGHRVEDSGKGDCGQPLASKAEDEQSISLQPSLSRLSRVQNGASDFSPSLEALLGQAVGAVGAEAVLGDRRIGVAGLQQVGAGRV